jgi:hypothetical protein
VYVNGIEFPFPLLFRSHSFSGVFGRSSSTDDSFIEQSAPFLGPGSPATQLKRGGTMSKQAAEHHHKAAEHHEHAARHHREAAAHHEQGNHEVAAHHAHTAQGHLHHATHHSTEAAKHHVESHGHKAKAVGA